MSQLLRVLTNLGWLASGSTEILRRIDAAFTDKSGLSYLSFSDVSDHLSIGRLMMRTDLFTSEDRDLVDDLRIKLEFEDRADAVRLFIASNRYEIMSATDYILRSTNEVKFLLAVSRTSTRALKDLIRPYRQALSFNLDGRRSRPCLFEFLPMGLRFSDAYHRMFNPLDPQEYRVLPGEAPGMLACLPDESQLDYGYTGNLFNDKDRRVIKVSKESGDRLIDVSQLCAVSLSPKFVLCLIIPDRRFFAAVEVATGEALFWREDSLGAYSMSFGGTPIACMRASAFTDIFVQVELVTGEHWQFLLPCDLALPFEPHPAPEYQLLTMPATRLVQMSLGVGVFTWTTGTIIQNFKRMLHSYESVILHILVDRLKRGSGLTDDQVIVDDIITSFHADDILGAYRGMLRLGSTEDARVARFLQTLQ